MMEAGDAGGRSRARLAAFGTPALVLFFSAILCFTPGPALGQSKEHPLLPDVKTAKWLSCHYGLTTKKVVHAPLADGCDTCHVLENKGGKTLASLSGKERELCLACHSKSRSR